MASREEEKRLRREARLEQEAKEAKAAARNKRLQMVLGGVLAVLIVVGVVIGITAAGGDDGGSEQEATATQVDGSSTDATLPEQQTADPVAAADAAGCQTLNPKNEGRAHEEREFTPADYEANPPTSGTHFPEWAEDGIYAPGKTPPLGETVHTLEHGRIDVQYAPGSPQRLIDQLEAFVAENDGYHMVLFENQTGMDAQVAATAWDWSLTCGEVNDNTWDALRTFRDEHLDKAPEKVP